MKNIIIFEKSIIVIHTMEIDVTPEILQLFPASIRCKKIFETMIIPCNLAGKEIPEYSKFVYFLLRKEAENFHNDTVIKFNNKARSIIQNKTSINLYFFAVSNNKQLLN